LIRDSQEPGTPEKIPRALVADRAWHRSGDWVRHFHGHWHRHGRPKIRCANIRDTPLLHYLIHHTAMAGRPGADRRLPFRGAGGIVCVFTGLCYAELASMIPIAGSAYTYTYATLGELVAWIIGWDLILEYAFSNMSVSVGLSAHIVDLLDWFGLHPPVQWISPAYLPTAFRIWRATTSTSPAGTSGSTFPPSFRHASHCHLVRRHPRVSPHQQRPGSDQDGRHPGFHLCRRQLHQAPLLAPVHAQWLDRRTDRAAPSSFYLHRLRLGLHSRRGCKNPQRDLPFGIMATLVACTVLYGGVALVLSGIVPWQSVMGDAAPVVNAIKRLSLLPGGHNLIWVRLFVLIGAIAGHDLLDSRLPAWPGARLVRHVARWLATDRFQPHPSKIPDTRRSHVGGRFVVAFRRIAGHWHRVESLKHRHTICLCAVRSPCSSCACASRSRHRSFRVPLVRSFLFLSIIFCVVLMMGLEVMTWMAFFAWLVTGLLIISSTAAIARSSLGSSAVQVSKPRHFDCAQAGLCDTSMLCLVKCPGKWATGLLSLYGVLRTQSAG